VAQEPMLERVARRRLRRPAPPRAGVCNGDTPISAVIPPGHQICSGCGVLKPVQQFHFRDKPKSRRHSWCSECFNAYRRDHYRLNRAEYIQRNSRILRQRGRRWLQRIWEYLLVHPCVDCGESDPLVLEFDHIDRSTKRQTVSFLARSGYPWATIEAEIAKCQVRCANCHRSRTARQFDWPKLRLSSAGKVAPVGS
jgi:hypothetical protein